MQLGTLTCLLVRPFSRVRLIVDDDVCVHVNLMKMPRRMSRSCNVHVHRIDMRVAYNDVVAWSNDSLELLRFNLTSIYLTIYRCDLVLGIRVWAKIVVHGCIDSTRMLSIYSGSARKRIRKVKV